MAQDAAGDTIGHTKEQMTPLDAYMPSCFRWHNGKVAHSKRTSAN